MLDPDGRAYLDHHTPPAGDSLSPRPGPTPDTFDPDSTIDDADRRQREADDDDDRDIPAVHAGLGTLAFGLVAGLVALIALGLAGALLGS